MSMSRDRRIQILTASALFGALCLGGCASNKLDEKADELRSNPSPELDTMYQRQSDIKNAQTVTADENFRMLNQDLGRFWLLDRPSRLTPEPVPR